MSLSVTFCHFLTNFWEVSPACVVHTNASARHGDTMVLCIQTNFLQNLCSKLLLPKGVNAHFLSLLITFCHFLSLLHQLSGGVTGMFCAHQCLYKAWWHCIQTVFIKIFVQNQKVQMLTFCHLWSLSVTFAPTFGRCHQHVLCTPMPQQIIMLWCTTLIHYSFYLNNWNGFGHR
jgi:hypothetical protein